MSTPTHAAEPTTETDNPFALFETWLAEAEASEPNDANAMALASVDARGRHRCAWCC